VRILQTPVRFYPHIGGVESYVYNLSRELVEMGYDVSVICANEPNVGDGVVNGIKVKRLGYVGKIANTNITPKLPCAIWKENFDVIHTHLPTPWSADWSAIVSKIKNKPLVLTYHNDIVGFGFTKYVAELYNRTMLKAVLKQADRMIVTSKKNLEFSTVLKDYEEKIEVIPPGVDTNRFKPLKIKKEENSIFFLSVLDRYHEYKGLSYLLKALKIVKEEIKDVKLTVGGSGELLDYYRKMAHSLGLERNVEFAGYIPDERIPYYYNRSSLFALPSTSPQQEGFGIVLLEAMACGIPVVASEIVGVADEVRKENAGFIIPTHDIESLVNAVIAVLKDKKFGKNARKLAEKYEWGRIAKRIFRIYTAVTSHL